MDFVKEKKEEMEEKAEEKVEEKIYEEGGYPALWKYKTVRMLQQCGCIQ